MKERALLFGKPQSLVGVLTEPASTSEGGRVPAVIILNAGLLHRVGPNRLHVSAARKMAQAGFTVLRFDFSGLGDSLARESRIPSEKQLVLETQETMDFLMSSKKIEEFVLMGLCSGADVALRTACADERVAGAIMINGVHIHGRADPRVASLAAESVRRRYYRGHLFDIRSWSRLFHGRSDYGGILRLLTAEMRRFVGRDAASAAESGVESDWRLLLERDVDLFLVYSEGSAALDMFRLTLDKCIPRLPSDRRLTVEIVENADHVFTLLWSQEYLVDLICAWALENKRPWFSRRAQ